MSADPLAALVTAWLDSTDSPNTRRARQSDVETWCGWLATRTTNVLEASAADVADYGQALADTAAGPNTVARRLSSLSSFYAFAVAKGVIAANPAVDPPVSLERWYRRTALTPLTADQARAYLAAADADRPRTAAIARLPLEVGLTTGQLAAALISDLRLEAGQRAIALKRAWGLQLVALPAPTAAAIDRTIAGRIDGPLLATRNGRAMAPSQLFRATQRAARLAGIEDHVSPSLWRATFRQLAIQAGARVVDVEIHLGLLPPPPAVSPSEALARSPAHLVAQLLEAAGPAQQQRSHAQEDQ